MAIQSGLLNVNLSPVDATRSHHADEREEAGKAGARGREVKIMEGRQKRMAISIPSPSTYCINGGTKHFFPWDNDAIYFSLNF